MSVQRIPFDTEGSYRLVVAADLTELLDAVRFHLDSPNGKGFVRLVKAYNLFVSNPKPATPDPEA